MHLIDKLRSTYHRLSLRMGKHSVELLRFALAVIFIWFGYLKLVGLSPARDLVAQTVYYLPPEWFVPFLGLWEVGIGIGLIIKKLIPFTIVVLLIHMVGTFLPFVILPEICFVKFPFCPSIEGQYILKNLVLVSAALAVAGKYNLNDLNS